MPNLAPAIPYVLAIAAVGSLWLAVQYRKHRRYPGALWFARSLDACAVWMLLYAASFIVNDPATQVLARQLIWPLVLVASLSFFRFACAYTQRPSWWNAIRVPVAVGITLELVLMLTNPQHHLMWRGSKMIEFGSARIPWLEPGTAFYWLHVPLGYGLSLGGVLALFVHALESPFYVRRALILSAAMLIPTIVNVFVIAQWANGPDLTPLALAASFAMLARTTFRYRLLEVMPAARNLLFQQYRDGVIVLDTDARVVDANATVGRMLGIEAPPGTSVATLLPFWDEVAHSEERARVEVAHAGAVFEVRSLLIHDERANVIGRLLVLHDITERARLVRELHAYARTVAHDLKNPLSGAMGYLDLAREAAPNLDEESKRLFDEASDTCYRMVDIITDLLSNRPAAAKIDSAQIKEAVT